MALLSDLRTFVRFAEGLGRFLRDPLPLDACRRIAREAIERREANFLRVLERAVYARAASPYRPLLERCGCELGDVRALVEEEGVEGALERLHDEGVRVSLEEFKARSGEFDNPLLTKHYEGGTGGTGGASRRLDIDLGLLAHEAAWVALYHAELGILDHPTALWYTVPPGTAGMKNLLRRAKVGRPVERWFAQTMPELRRGRVKPSLFLRYALWSDRLSGRRLVGPQHTPLFAAADVARWLEAHRAEGGRPVLLTSVGAGIRVCLAAGEKGIDIAGSFFRLGGEPLTPARARVFTDAGCEAVVQYSMSETGFIAVPCGREAEVDGMHVLQDKVALIQRRTSVAGAEVAAFFLTTVLPSSPKLMVNVETGDYGVLEPRACGCAFDQLGLGQHVHGVRSYEKLTSEGMTFYGEELMRVIEEVLPARFGGGPTDYQFVEEEQDGRVSVSLYAAPSLGPIDPIALGQAALRGLGGVSGTREMMSEVWRQGEVLRIVRADPLSTGVAKVLPLHLRRSTEATGRRRA